jgi:hypothetical protein
MLPSPVINTAMPRFHTPIVTVASSFLEQQERGRREWRNRETSHHGAGTGADGPQSSNSSTHVRAVSTVRFRSCEQPVYSLLSMTRATSYSWGSICLVTDPTDSLLAEFSAIYEPTSRDRNSAIER